jgi:Anti-sigma-28 factor, FlgM
MHIQRFDSGSRLKSGPAGIRLTQTNAGGSALAEGTGNNNSRGTGELRELSDQIAAIPDVRADVVEASRMKLQRGDYLTRVAAEQTADAFLTRGI